MESVGTVRDEIGVHEGVRIFRVPDTDISDG
jgi:hypothetical protein